MRKATATPTAVSNCLFTADLCLRNIARSLPGSRRRQSCVDRELDDDVEAVGENPSWAALDRQGKVAPRRFDQWSDLRVVIIRPAWTEAPVVRRLFEPLIRLHRRDIKLR